MGKLYLKQAEFTIHISQLIIYAESIGVLLTFGDAYRPEYLQKHYVETGRSWTMNSDHLKRLAVDFNFFVDGQLVYNHPKVKQLGVFWESLNPGNYWGGHFKAKRADFPHFGRK